MSDSVALAIGLGVVFLYLLIIGIGIASYIIQSLALQGIAKRRGINNPWLSWIPVANTWIIGSIADEYDNRNGIKRKWRVLLLTLSIIIVAIAVLFYIAMIAFVVSMAFSGMADYMTEEQTIGFVLVLYAGIIPLALCAFLSEFCTYICIFKIFESSVPEKAVKYFILSFLVPLALPICLIKCKDKGYAAPDVYSNVIYPNYQPESANLPE